MNLTIPEVVTPYNIDNLSKLVMNGPEKYPGANVVFPASNAILGKRMAAIHLRYRKEKVDLRYGDIVERHIIDGDYVLFNRQPTLHKLSMIGHKIKVIHDPNINTFGVNLSVVTGFNADFDGDKRSYCLQQQAVTWVVRKTYVRKQCNSDFNITC